MFEISKIRQKKTQCMDFVGLPDLDPNMIDIRIRYCIRIDVIVSQNEADVLLQL